MRQVTRYSSAIKDSVLAKALAPNPPRVVELGKEYNIPAGTIYTWIINMRNKKNKVVPTRPDDKSAEAKLRALIDTSSMSEEEIGAYCREHGIYTHHLDEWRNQCLQGFGVTMSRKEAKEERKLQNENKKLERELRKKDKALAEVSALLILKKKADLIWGKIDEDD